MIWFQILVTSGGKVNKANEFYETPLHMAAMRNEPECLEFLLLNGEFYKKTQ